jgi:hypothetical protein
VPYDSSPSCLSRRFFSLLGFNAVLNETLPSVCFP